MQKKITSKIKRVLFITAPNGIERGCAEKPFYTNAPVAFLWLSAYLEERGIECHIHDGYTKMSSLSDIMKWVDDIQPDLIGFSVFTVTVYDNLTVARRIREQFPDKVIVFGGYHTNYYYEDVLKNDCVDFCTLKEGEETLHELIECINTTGEIKSDEVKKISGIAWKKNGQLHHTLPRDFRNSLSDMPFLPYKKVMDNKYIPWCFNHDSSKTYMTTVTSKGCPMQCVFCDIGKTEGKKFRPLTAERVIKEVEYMYHELGINQIEFLDPLFTVQRDRVREIAGMLIDRKMDIEWACSSTIRLAEDKEMLDLMRKSGCKKIFYGVETGNPDMLRKIKKLTTETVKNVVQMTHQSGIKSHTSFILGLPGDTPQTMRETIDFAKSLGQDTVSFSIAIPYKGTELYDLYEKDIYDWNWRNWEGKAVFRTKEYTPEYLEKMVLRAHREFYLRPRYVLSRFKQMRTWKDFGAHMKIGTSLLLGKLGYKNEAPSA